MAKVIRGTGDKLAKEKAVGVNKPYRIVRGPKDARQVRCPGCKELASQVPDGMGGFTYKCRCGRQFAHVPM